MENKTQTNDFIKPPQTPKLDHSKITPMNRSATWDDRKKACMKQATEEYPHIPQIAIEAMYDFSLKYEHDETIEKYFKGEHLNPKQLKKVEKILHPKGYSIKTKIWENNETIQGVSVLPAESLKNEETKETEETFLSQKQNQQLNDYQKEEEKPAESNCKII